MTGRKVMLDTNCRRGDKRLYRHKGKPYAEEKIIRYGCDIYALSKLDFVDCLLVGYANVYNRSVFTFDNDLKKQLGHKAHAY